MLRKLFVGYVFLTLVVMGCGVIARSQPTPTPTRTPKPTFTATSTFAPTPVVMATATPLPMDTPITSPKDTPVPAAMDTPVHTDTPVPTDTPAPTKPPAPPPPPAPTATPVPPPPPPPDKDFKIAKRQLFCQGVHVILITVVDINGAPLDGVVLKVTDPNPDTKDEEPKTGDKGPGKAEALMWGEHWVWVERDASGKTYGKDRSEIAEHVDKRPLAGDLRAAGMCDGLNDEECDAKRYESVGQCSYDLVFQRQW